MTTEVRGLRDGEEYEEMLTVVARGFGHPVEAVRRRFERHPPYRLEGTRVVLLDGRMVSVVQVHELQVRGHDGDAWLVGGIGEVATPPEHRHHGYATLALTDAISTMERLGCQFSMLFTGQQPFYERLSWRPYPIAHLSFNPKKVALAGARVGGQQSGDPGALRRAGAKPALGQVQGRLRQSTPGVTVREMNWARDLPALRRIYVEYNRDKVGPLLRSDAYWREAAYPRRRSGSSWIALRRRAPVAYLWGAAELRVLELPHLPGEEDAARELLLHALRVAREESFKQVVLSEPCVPIACELADGQPRGAITRTTYRSMMLRPIAPGFSTDFAPGEFVYYGTDSF